MDQAAPAPALTLNPSTLQLGGPLACVDVSDHDCSLLRAFVDSAGHRLETAALLALTDRAGMLGKRALEVRIVRLRKKLAQAGAPAPTIKSIRGVGYQLCVPLAISSSRHSIQEESSP